MTTIPHVVYWIANNIVHFRTSDNHTGSNHIDTTGKETLKSILQFYPKYTLERILHQLWDYASCSILALSLRRSIP